MILFQNITILWLIILVPIVIWLIGHFSRRSRVQYRRLWLVTVVTSLLGLIVALAGPYYLSASGKSGQVLLLDVSDSISDTALAANIQLISGMLGGGAEGAKSEIVAFAQECVSIEPAELPGIIAARRDCDGVFSGWQRGFFNQTDISSALCRALESLKQNGQIGLFSDLYQTNGDISPLLPVLAGNNIKLEFIPPATMCADEVVMTNAEFMGRVQLNVPVNIKVSLESTCSCPAVIRVLSQAGDTMAELPVELKSGTSSYIVPVMAGQMQTFNCVAKVESAIDTERDNNSRILIMPVFDRLNICLMGLPDGIYEDVSVLLADEQTTVIKYDNEGDLEQADLLIVNELPADDIKRLCDYIHQRVSSGMGLLVMPGVQQGMTDSLAEILPASFVRDRRGENPDTAVVFVVDTSGSMKEQPLILAKEVIKFAIAQLGQSDLVGIVEFYGNKRWSVPMQPAGNHLYIERSLNRLVSEGGSIILSAIEEAYYAISSTRATTRHVVIVTDGNVQKADFYSLIKRMADDKIVVTTVLIGNATQTEFLAEIAQIGRGKFCQVKDNIVLPSLDFKEIFNKPGSVMDQDVKVISSAMSYSFLSDIDVPAMSGKMTFFQTRLKTGADTLLLADGVMPLLSSWNYYNGTVALCGSDMFSRNLDNASTMALLQSLCRKLVLDNRVLKSSDLAVNVPQEVQGCHYDQYLASRLNVKTDSNISAGQMPVELWPWCVAVTLVLFIANIVIRRLPGQGRPGGIRLIILLICLVLFGSDSRLGAFEKVLELPDMGRTDNYPGLMFKGLDLYLTGDYNAAIPTFVAAARTTQSNDDINYAIAWSLLAADKVGGVTSLADQLLADKKMAQINARQLLFFMGYSKNLSGLQQLRSLLIELPDSNADKQTLLKEITDVIGMYQNGDTEVQLHFDSLTELLSCFKSMLRADKGEQAEQMVEAFIDSNSDPEILLSLARYIGQYGLSSQALKAATKVVQDQENTRDIRFAGAIVLCELHIKQGNTGNAVAILDDLAAGGEITDQQLYTLCSLYQEVGEYASSYKLLSDIYRTNGTDGILLEMSKVAVKAGDSSGAFACVLEAWRNSRQGYEFYLLEPQLLYLANCSGNMVKLLAILEQQVADNIDREKSIDLLATIYIDIDDTATIVELVKQYYGSDSIESLRKQALIYQRAREFSLCVKVLTKLIKADPANMRDYLYSMAVVAIEKNAPALSCQALSIMHEQEWFDTADLQFSAGIYSLLGDNASAVECYQKILDTSASEEIWYYWSRAAEKCGSAQKVIDRLEAIVSEDMPDDLLCMIADILMKMDARPDVLRKVLAVVIARNKISVNQMVFYDLITDLMAELKYSSESIIRVKLAATIYSAPRRFSLLREMAVFSSDGLNAVDMEMLSLSLNYRTSNTEIGKSIMDIDRSDLAEFFYKVYILPDAKPGTILEIVDNFDKQGKFQQAADILCEALLLYRDDLSLRFRQAGYYEIMGDLSAAYKQYEKVYDKLTRVSFYDLTDAGDDSISQSIRSLRQAALEGLIDTATGQQALGLADNIASQIDLDSWQTLTGPAIYKQLSLFLDQYKVLLAYGDIDRAGVMISELPSGIIFQRNFYLALLQQSIDHGYVAGPIANYQELDLTQLVALLTNDSGGKTDIPLSVASAADTETEIKPLAQEVSEKVASERVGVILSFLGELEHPLTEQEVVFLTDTIKNSPPYKVADGNSYRSLLKKTGMAYIYSELVQDIMARAAQNSPDNITIQAVKLVIDRYAGIDNAQLAQRAEALLNAIVGNVVLEYDHPYIMRDLIAMLTPEKVRASVEKYRAGENNDKASVLLYCMFGSERLGEKVQALAYAVELFNRYPDNTFVFLAVTDIFTLYDNDKRLLTILKQKLVRGEIQSGYSWRELYRQACQDGDYDIAALAAGHDAGVTNFLNYLYLGVISHDTELMRQYFRKTMVDARRQRQYISFKWPREQSVGGLTGFVTDYEPAVDTFIVLASQMALADEFHRYARTVTCDKRYYPKYKEALDIIAGNYTKKVQEFTQEVRPVYNSQKISVSEHMDILLAYMRKGDVPGMERQLRYIIEDNRFNPREMEMANLMYIKDCPAAEQIKQQFIERARQYLLELLENSGARRDNIVKYLCMLAVLEASYSQVEPELLMVLARESQRNNDLALWYLDVLNYCHYDIQAEELTRQLREKGALPYLRLQSISN